MDKKHDKLMTDIQRILGTQDFKSEEEMTNFLKKLMEDEIPSFPKEALNFEEQAQDLVFEAYELSPVNGKQKIIEALDIHPDCIEAYEYLASIEPVVEISIAFYNMGITLGRKLFGGDYLKENKGHFWGLHETRPFMRCMQAYADSLNSIGKTQESVTIMEEMLELNPNDNQGVRDLLMLNLIELDEDEKFVKYEQMFKEDESAALLFNNALFAFKTKGEGIDANYKLSLALKQNKFVAKQLLSKREQKTLPDTYGYGDVNEANLYTFFAQYVWPEVEGALTWLKKHNGK